MGLVDQLLSVPRSLVRTGGDALRRAQELVDLPRKHLGTDDLSVKTHRNEGNAAAVVFVHGFGVSEKTWGELPELLGADPALAGWDLHSVGYNSKIVPDLRGVWSADPDLGVLSTFLRSRTRLAPLAGYEAIAFVAHSMGGLIVQRALVDDAELVGRTSHFLMYGTPSGGLTIARWGSVLKSQIRDMGDESDFITDLRRRWDDQFGTDRPFHFWAVAGDRDVFVPASSSLAPFPADTQVVIPGNHLEICFAQDAEEMSVQVLVDALVGEAAPGGPWNGARVAVEGREFHRAVEVLAPHAAELDEPHLVELALALAEIGERDRAIETLRDHATGTDAKGTLAGRLKRAWMAEGRQRDAEQAYALYLEAHEEAVGAGDHEQAAYHGINLAFLDLAHLRDAEAAARRATDALAHCAASPASAWRAATEGEAHVYLGDGPAALAAYRTAVEASPSPRELATMYAQASWAADLVGDGELQQSLTGLFRPGTS